MRIGKKKAAAKRKGRESPEQQRAKKKSTGSESPDEFLENFLNTRRNEEAPGVAPLPALSLNATLRETPQALHTPRYSGVDHRSSPSMAWSDSFFPGQVELNAAPLQPQRSFPQLDDNVALPQLGDTLPVAAALTGVFQEQFISSNIARRPSPATREDDDEHFYLS